MALFNAGLYEHSADALSMVFRIHSDNINPASKRKGVFSTSDTGYDKSDDLPGGGPNELDSYLKK